MICAGRIYDPWGSRRCVYAGKVERDGKWYCRIHDPGAKAERLAKQDGVWKARMEHDLAVRAERQRRDRLADCAQELLEASEALLNCRWVRETASIQVDNLRTAIAHAKGLQP